VLLANLRSGFLRKFVLGKLIANLKRHCGSITPEFGQEMFELASPSTGKLQISLDQGKCSM